LLVYWHFGPVELTNPLQEHYKVERENFMPITRAFAQSVKVLIGCVAGLILTGNLTARERVRQAQPQLETDIAGVRPNPGITSSNWGSFGAPVSGMSESAAGYDGAEPFAGPQKFKPSGDADYYHGVLPNGRIVKPAGTSTQVGMNPLGIALTPDGRFAIVSNDDERKGNLSSVQNSKNHGGYSLSVLDTSATPMTVVSQVNSDQKLFIGLQVTANPEGGYILYASGGGDNSVDLFNITSDGAISASTNPATIPIHPILPANQGWVSNYAVAGSFKLDAVPSPASNTDRAKFGDGARITFPAGSALTPDGKYLCVACNGDNSIAVIDVGAKRVVAQYSTGYFPYAIVISPDGRRVAVSNWGIIPYKFAAPSYDSEAKLTAIRPTAGPRGEPDEPGGFYVPVTDKTGKSPKTSSVSLFQIPNGDPGNARLVNAIDEGKRLDHFYQVGDTHPSAMAIVAPRGRHVLYVTRTNDDSLGLIDLDNWTPVKQIRLPLLSLATGQGHFVTGTYPNALSASHDGRRLYIAEAGINSVAVLDTSDPQAPTLLGRIPTGWWPSALTLSPDDKVLYIVNAKGIGEDINPAVDPAADTPPATGVESFEDSNFVFGTVQKVVLQEAAMSPEAVTGYNLGRTSGREADVVPQGGKQGSKKIRHVIFIEQENKTFDSVLGGSGHFGPYASTSFHKADGRASTSAQYNPVTQNTTLLANSFATAVNYYSDSEESDAGHEFCASGTATDYTEKTLLVKNGRGLLVNKNMEPEDYPASGYIFNNAARNGVSFKDYGELVRIDGTDTGNSLPTRFDDPPSGKMGYPSLPQTNPVIQTPGSDVDNRTQGLGQAYFIRLPMLAVLGESNRNGESHLDKDYPGYNFNISDQRRALEFVRDFDRMVRTGTVPRFMYIYLPNDHTGETTADNFGIDPKTGKPVRPTAPQQVQDGDVALGMVVERLLKSPLYYDPKTDTGLAIFITFDDAQATLDHIHPHRTPLIVVSPFAKPGYIAKAHYSTASIVKTEELLLGLPPNNLGDLVATDLHDLFQSKYNGVELVPGQFNRVVQYTSTPAGQQIWDLVNGLNTAEPDQDSRRLGALGRLTMEADDRYHTAEQAGQLEAEDYLDQQRKLMEAALTIAGSEP
jgi:YVTN family beta-propeller protein